MIEHKHRSQQVKITNCHEILESVFGYYPIACSLDLAKGYFLSVSGKSFAAIEPSSRYRYHIIWNCGIRHDGGHSPDAWQ
tara:strand:- start:167 stop:406 length:240 start_codon:yes stop_codon:yes gene_type:complete